MADFRAAYKRCLLETKNLFRANEELECIPTSGELSRYAKTVEEEKRLAAGRRFLGDGSAVTAPLALVDVDAIPAEPGRFETLADQSSAEPKSASRALVAKGVLDTSAVPTYHPKWRIKRVLVGHTGWVRAIDVDATNEWFATGGNDRLVKIWDLATGELKLTLTGHIHGVRGIKISARHPYLFSAGEDHVLKCWDLEANQVVRQYRGHMSAVYTLDIHPHLDVLVSGSRDSTVRIWDMRTRDELMCMRGHTGSVFSVIAQDHEPQIISGSSDRTIRTWDLKTGKTMNILTHHSKSIRALAAHPRHWSFISAGSDDVKVWHGHPPIFQRDYENAKSIVNTIAIKDDPRSALTVLGCDNGLLQFYDHETGRKVQSIESTPVKGSLYSEAGINVACFDKSESRLLTGEADKTVRIWEEIPADE